MREAGIQEFFTEGNIIPMVVVYEDFARQYEQTILTILDYLEVDTKSVSVPPPPLEQTANADSEEWIQRFREERQEGWQNRGW